MNLYTQAIINTINRQMIKMARSVCHRNLYVEHKFILLDELLCLLLVFDPNGVPQFMQTNRPASERSALYIEPPQQQQGLELMKSLDREHF